MKEGIPRHQWYMNDMMDNGVIHFKLRFFKEAVYFDIVDLFAFLDNIDHSYIIFLFFKFSYP